MDEHSPAVAERFVRRELCAEHHGSMLDEVELVISELVTNGVRHGAPPIAVTLTCQGRESLRVEVADGSHVTTTQRRPTAAMDESGRGLTLVDYTSNAWGAAHTAEGKRVWCILRPADDPLGTRPVF